MEIIYLLRDVGIFGLAMWFIQHLLTKSANRKIESYKTELDHKTREFQALLDSKIELYKAELNIQNYKSTKIYESQMKVIVELHKKLVTLSKEMQIMTTLLNQVIKDAETEEIERINNAGKAYYDFFNFFHENKIFLPQSINEKIHVISDDYWDSFNDYTFGKNYEFKSSFTYEKSIQASKKIRDQIQPAVDSLISHFRLLIGVE